MAPFEIGPAWSWPLAGVAKVPVQLTVPRVPCWTEQPVSSRGRIWSLKAIFLRRLLGVSRALEGIQRGFLESILIKFHKVFFFFLSPYHMLAKHMALTSSG